MLTNRCRRTADRLGRVLGRLVRAGTGQDLIEYALLTGIIAIAGILVFPTIQTKMAATYQAWNDTGAGGLATTATCCRNRSAALARIGEGSEVWRKSMSVAEMISLGLAVVACGWDLRTRRIPQVLTLGGALAGLRVTSGQWRMECGRGERRRMGGRHRDFLRAFCARRPRRRGRQAAGGHRRLAGSDERDLGWPLRRGGGRSPGDLRRADQGISRAGASATWA